jgi:hypothetical protein
MARNPTNTGEPPRVPAPTPEETPHGCYEDWIYMGFEGEDENGERTEVIERVPCRRCIAEPRWSFPLPNRYPAVSAP